MGKEACAQPCSVSGGTPHGHRARASTATRADLGIPFPERFLWFTLKSITKLRTDTCHDCLCNSARLEGWLHQRQSLARQWEAEKGDRSGEGCGVWAHTQLSSHHPATHLGKAESCSVFGPQTSKLGWHHVRPWNPPPSAHTHTYAYPCTQGGPTVQRPLALAEPRVSQAFGTKC